MSDAYCPICAEPWETDSIHDEVAKRYPDKPWMVDTKPEPYHQPDTETNWCGYKIGPEKLCWQPARNHPLIGHEFIPYMQKEYRSYNTSPLFYKENGKWNDEKIYAELYEPIAAEFRRKGCEIFGVPHNDTKANPALSAIYEMNGDDMDAAIADMEDNRRTLDL